MKLLILYASQTGNAEQVAYDLGRECMRRAVPISLHKISELPTSELPSIPIVIFVVSTTGLGEVPDSMLGFWNSLLNTNLPEDLLEDMKFSVFGLGDSSYPDFNATARMLSIRLKQLGASEFYGKGLGDDMHDFEYESEYHPWTDGLWASLTSHFTVQEPISTLLEPMYIIENSQEVSEDNDFCEIISHQQIGFDMSHSYMIKIKNEFQYEPGDTFEVKPPNSDEAVTDFMSLMGWEDRNITIRQNPIYPFCQNQFLHQSISLFSLLKWHLDLYGQATRHFIALLSEFSSGVQQEKLREMASKTLEGRNEFHRYIVKERRNVVEVLWDFDTARRIPLEYFIEGCRWMQYRSFSIASYEKNIELMVSLVNHTTPLRRKIKGLCTSYLENVRPGHFIKGYIKKGRMNFNIDADRGLLLIGTGVGLAPLRSLLHKRIMNGARDNTLFLGVRHPDKDFYCKDELHKISEDGYLSLFVAFSRVENRAYVQQAIKKEYQHVAEKLTEGAFVLICGKSRYLEQNIKDCFLFCLKEEGYPEDVSINILRDLDIYTESW